MTQSFFIASMGQRKVEAAALLLIGGGGNGILPVILDNPSDQQAGEGMGDAFRESREGKPFPKEIR